MVDNQIILTGWKDICGACGIKSKTTMKKKAKKYNMPITYMDGRPVISKEAIIEWWNIIEKRIHPEITQGYIYFLQHGEDGAIKIGFAKDIEKRIKQIQEISPVPLRLLAKIKGTMMKEAALHNRFKRYRLKNEWFTPASNLIEYIEKVNQIRT